MKQDKVFVRFNNFDEGPPPGRGRNDKRPYEKKKYAEKQVKTRQAFKHIADSFQASNSMPKNVQQLLKKYPKFFNREGKAPQKENNELLNDYLILQVRKYYEGLKQTKKQPEPMLSSSDPDWNSDDDVDCDMESKCIEASVVDKVIGEIKGKPINRPDKLKPHEIKFLEDYYLAKKQQKQQTANEAQPSAQNKQKKQQINQTNSSAIPEAQSIKNQQTPLENYGKVQQIKGSNVNWSDYQERQLNTFVDMGFMTKIQDNQNEEMGIEVIEDDQMFNQESNKSQSSSSKRSSSSEDQEDDIFGDQTPTTTTIKKEEPVQVKVQSDKKITQGTVSLNTRIFSQIVESIGLLPSRCNWIIRNDYTKYKVSTDYMDAYYRKERMFEMLPLISLNHSQFVRNENIETPEGQATLKDFNSRKIAQYNYKPKFNYRDTHHYTHHKKK